MRRSNSSLASIAGAWMLLAGIVLSPASSSAAKSIPNPPYYYVLDEPQILSPAITRSLQALLIEHDRTTSEQVVIAVFKSLENEDLVEFTNRVFTQWKIGQRGKNNGVLLALYWDDRKARIEVGYGLEPLLTDAKSKGVLEDFLIPELRAGSPDRALSLAALEILRILESPLIENGKAQEILRTGGLTGGWTPAPRNSSGGISGLGIFVGLLFLIFVLNSLLSPQAHYTSRGWYRPRPWGRRRTLWYGGGGWGGGGLGGGGLGGGGFRGGGGMSGGGGASGSW